MLSALMIAPQFLLFMRTDLYFVLQDLTGCRNLYADGSAYVRWLARFGRGQRPDPSQALARGERRAVRGYAWVLLFGTAICVTVALVVTVPFAIAVLTTAATRLVEGSASQRVDGVLTLCVTGGYWTLWAAMWWRRHGHRARALRGRLFRTSVLPARCAGSELGEGQSRWTRPPG